LRKKEGTPAASGLSAGFRKQFRVKGTRVQRDPAERRATVSPSLDCAAYCSVLVLRVIP